MSLNLEQLERLERLLLSSQSEERDEALSDVRSEIWKLMRPLTPRQQELVALAEQEGKMSVSQPYVKERESRLKPVLLQIKSGSELLAALRMGKEKVEG